MAWSLTELEHLLSDLLRLSSEKEWLEFKEAKNQFDIEEIRKYFSALSNEASLIDLDPHAIAFS